MSSNSPRHRQARGARLLAPAGLIVLTAITDSVAAPIEKYTGYTRPGYLPVGEDAKVLPAAGATKALGVTVYFSVFDRKLRRVVKGDPKVVEGDTFGIGVEGFDDRFIAGIDSDVLK